MSHTYTRLETDEMKAYYTPSVPLTDEVEMKVEEFLARLLEESKAFRGLTGWAVEAERLAQAAGVFARVASEHFKVTLSLDDEDPLHLDAFLNQHLIAPELRSFFDGPKVKEGLPASDYEQLMMFIEGTAIPREESLYYFLGAYWGEWLVRHREAVWSVFTPLRPLQAFPDMVTSHGTVCLHPFSQVLNKLTDPIGDSLANKAQVFPVDYLPRYPLIASIADANEATLSLMPEPARRAYTALATYDLEKALELMLDGLEQDPENLPLLAEAAQVAWQAEQWELTHKAMTALLRMRPHPRTYYNLGVFYAQFEAMDEAIESLRQAVLLNPRYDRAKMTMALLLAEVGEIDAAREIAQMLLAEGSDPAIQSEARNLLLRLE
ncbi:MAG: tetratricopeptide repeat protein [Tumebacillaceae bacterium]